MPAAAAPGLCCAARSKENKGVATIRNVHDGEGKNWREAFCSWCYEETVHYHVAQTQSWLCDACKGRTTESPTSSDCMARLEGRGRRVVCAKAQPQQQWQQILARKRQILAEDRTVNQVRYEMTRDSPTRQLAAKAGVLRPFVLLVSMTPALRALLAVQLGLSPLSQPAFGDPHEEAWQILSHKQAGLQATCKAKIRGLGIALNPFASPPDWVGCLNHLCTTQFLPSYMSWSDIFNVEKMDKEEAHTECSRLHSAKVDKFELELMEKVAKQQRAKMNKFQICYVQQLLTTEAMKRLLQTHTQRGWDRHSIALFCVDSCYLQLARDKHVQRQETIAPSEMAATMARFLSGGVSADDDVLADAALTGVLREALPDSIVRANFEPIWLTMGTIGLRPHTSMARVMPVVLEILLQKERLKIMKIDISSKEFAGIGR